MSNKISRKKAIQNLGGLMLSSVVPAAVNAAGLTNVQANSLSQSTPEPGAPNIIIIIADQIRADACKREGFELDTMPFVDSMAKDGTWMNRSYCAAPACVPSRTSMMTGRFPNATRVKSNMNIQDATFTADLVDVVKSKGYVTALIGKNHSYLKPSNFDHWKGYFHLGVDEPANAEQKAFNDYLKSTNYYVHLDPAPFPAEMQLPVQIVKSSKDWINENYKKDKPFFLYLSIPEPHNPYQVSEPYYSMFPPASLPKVKAGAEVLPKKGNKWVLQKKMMEMGYPHYEKNIPRIRSNYYGMLRLIDDQVKNLVEFLKEKGLYDNTVILFTGDHGDFTGEYGLIKKGVEVPECLTRIPMVWHGPGIVKNATPHTAHVSNVDVMPTICEMVGAKLPDGVQGRSLWPMLTGKKYPLAEFESVVVQQGFGGLHFTNLREYDPYTQDGLMTKGKEEFDELNTWSQSGIMRMLRKSDWKLVYDMQGAGQLYNLVKDPAEINNLYDNPAYKDKQAELMRDLSAWELRTQDPLPLPRPNKERHYGYKRDPHNYWSPYRNEPAEELKKNLKDI